MSPTCVTKLRKYAHLQRKLLAQLLLEPNTSMGYASSLRSTGPIVDGNYKSDEWTLFETPHQSIDKVSTTRTGRDGQVDTLTITGEVWGLVTKASYEMTFRVPVDDDDNDVILHNQIEFNIKVNPIRGEFNRLFLNYWCDINEKFYGFGTQFSHLNMKGRRLPIVVSEQGIGRGIQPTTFLLNALGDGVGGDWSSTYAPKLLYISNMMRSIVVLNSELMYFDARDDDSVVIEISSNSLTVRVINGETVPNIQTEITTITGRMRPLPDWTQNGAIVGLEGGTKEVNHNLEKLLNPKYSLPVVGVWLQDWVGLRHAYDGDRLNWNWRLDSQYYDNWTSMVKSWSSIGIRVLTYINPFFSPSQDIDNKNNLRNIFEEGLANDYYIRSSDGAKPYNLHSGSIDFHMLDILNDKARKWMKDIIKEEMIKNSLSYGWMADFAEYAPFDALYINSSNDNEKLYQSMTGSYHNLYPLEWAKLNLEAVIEAKEENIFENMKFSINSKSYRSNYIPKCDYCQNIVNDVQPHTEHLFFARSGWLQSPKYSSSFWLGDQLVSWDKHDGIKSAVVGMISSGISGHTLTHSDIGGYTMSEMGPFPFIRTKELLFRWIELSAFGSSLFRTHIGSSCNPVNKQIYDDNESIEFFSKFTKIFVYLRGYRKQLMNEAYNLGYPLIRSMFFHYQDDLKTWDVVNQFMFGKDFMIAPVLDPIYEESNIPYYSSFFKNSNNEDNSHQKGSKHSSTSSFANMKVGFVDVYIPSNTSWIHLWSGQKIDNSVSSDVDVCYDNIKGCTGRYIRVDAPIGCIPVFYLPESKVGQNLRNYIIKSNWDALTLSEEETVEMDINVNNTIIEYIDASDYVSSTFTKATEYDNSKPVIRPFIEEIKEKDWFDWLGISEYVSNWNETINIHEIRMDTSFIKS